MSIVLLILIRILGKQQNHNIYLHNYNRPEQPSGLFSFTPKGDHPMEQLEGATTVERMILDQAKRTRTPANGSIELLLSAI